MAVEGASGPRDAYVALGAVTVVVERQQMADRLGHVAADRVMPIANRTII